MDTPRAMFNTKNNFRDFLLAILEDETFPRGTNSKEKTEVAPRVKTFAPMRSMSTIYEL